MRGCIQEDSHFPSLLPLPNPQFLPLPGSDFHSLSWNAALSSLKPEDTGWLGSKAEEVPVVEGPGLAIWIGIP